VSDQSNEDLDSGSVVRRGDVVYEVDEVDRVDHVSASGQARRYGQDRDAPVQQLQRLAPEIDC